MMGLGLKYTGEIGEGEVGERGVCEAEGPEGTSGEDEAVNRGGFSGIRRGATFTRALALTGWMVVAVGGGEGNPADKGEGIDKSMGGGGGSRRGLLGVRARDEASGKSDSCTARTRFWAMSGVGGKAERLGVRGGTGDCEATDSDREMDISGLAPRSASSSSSGRMGSPESSSSRLHSSLSRKTGTVVTPDG